MLGRARSAGLAHPSSVTDARTDYVNLDYVNLYKRCGKTLREFFESRFPNPTVRAEHRFPNPTVRAGSAGGLKRATGQGRIPFSESDCPGRFRRRIKTRNRRVTHRQTHARTKWLPVAEGTVKSPVGARDLRPL